MAGEAAPTMTSIATSIAGQRLAVLLAGGGECLADRDRAAGLELDVRIGGAVFFEKRLEFGIDVR